MSTDQQPAVLHVERRPITHPDAQLLVEAVQEEYVARYGGRDESPIDPRDFEDPLGRFFVGYLDGVPVATGAWAVAGLGMGIAYSTGTLAVISTAEPGREGAASASVQLAEALGIALGTGLAGAVVALSAAGPLGLAPGIAIADLLLLVVLLLAIVAARRMGAAGPAGAGPPGAAGPPTMERGPSLGP